MLKKAFYTLVIGLGITFFLWLGLNLWPYPEEPDLYSEEDLKLSESAKSDQNAWNLLKNESLPKINFPSPLGDLRGDVESLSSEAYWKKFSKNSHLAEEALQKNKRAWKLYNKLIQMPYFLDSDSISYKDPKAQAGFLLDAHLLAWAYQSNLILNGKSREAYELWLKMFKKDLSWLRSTRGMVSYSVAATSLKSHLDILKMLKKKTVPENWEKIKQDLLKLKEDDFNFERSLAYDYRWALFSLNSLTQAPSKGFFDKLFLNPNLTKNKLNEIYKIHQTYLANPLANPDQQEKEIKQLIADGEKPWWFINPAGKAFLSMVSIYYFDLFKELHKQKNSILQLRDQLI